MIKRLARIVGAYFVGSQAAGFAYVTGGLLLQAVGTALGAQSLPWGGAEWSFRPDLIALLILAVGSTAGLFIMVVAFVPALIVIAVAEAARLRSLIFYVGAGALGAIACWAVFIQDDGNHGIRSQLAKRGLALSLAPENAPATAMLVLIAAFVGVIAGVVYWRIAGRSAGDWRVPRVASQNPSLVRCRISADAPSAGSQAPPS